VFLKETFGLFAHMNALQRDICPSQTRFEGEIIGMALDLMDAGEVSDGEPAGAGDERRNGQHLPRVRGVTRPNLIEPETAHPAFDKACHLFGVELRRSPVDPKTTLVRLDWVADNVDDETVAVVGSACNYGYGTVDPIGDPLERKRRHDEGFRGRLDRSAVGYRRWQRTGRFQPQHDRAAQTCLSNPAEVVRVRSVG
jgi:hypothetical protein